MRVELTKQMSASPRPRQDSHRHHNRRWVRGMRGDQKECLWHRQSTRDWTSSPAIREAGAPKTAARSDRKTVNFSRHQLVPVPWPADQVHIPHFSTQGTRRTRLRARRRQAPLISHWTEARGIRRSTGYWSPTRRCSRDCKIDNLITMCGAGNMNVRPRSSSSNRYVCIHQAFLGPDELTGRRLTA